LSCPLDQWLCRICSLPGSVPRPADLLCRQIIDLRRTLHHVWSHSAFYREHFRSLPACVREGLGAGVWPQTPEELTCLPFTSAEDLTGNHAWRRFLCVSQDDVARVVTLHTSGTTGFLSGGGSKRLAFTVSDLARTVDFFSMGMTLMVEPGDLVLVLLPGAERPGGVADLLLRGLARLGRGCSGSPFISPAYPPVCKALAMPADLTADQLASTLGQPANTTDRPSVCVVASPSQLQRLTDPADAAVQQVSEVIAGRVRTVLSSAEPLPSSLRAQVADVWDCEVFDHYGLTESGYGGGVECSAHDGYHWREADLWLEIVDPISRQPVPDGEMGEVVITTLRRQAMPLIRYRTGDAARILSGPCACGSPLRRLGTVSGRLLPGADGPHTMILPKAGGRGSQGAYHAEIS